MKKKNVDKRMTTWNESKIIKSIRKSLPKKLWRTFDRDFSIEKSKFNSSYEDMEYDTDITQRSRYRAGDNDEFAVGVYFEQKTGRGVDFIFRGIQGNQDSYCHSIESIEEIVKKYNFTRVWGNETYDHDDKTITGRYVYERVDEDGITVFFVNNRPSQYKSNKFDPSDARVFVNFMSNSTKEFFEQLRNDVIDTYFKPKIESNNICLVIQTHHGYDTETFDLPKQKIDIELNYGSEFVPVHKKILNELNKQKGKGLVLLHGDPGTGKTHYLKFLASKIKDKKVLFIPPFLADFITSPQMIPFLTENSNSVLFIEDAERVITDRKENGSNGVSNILNITDGILSDILNIQIVATFNMDKQRIDSALLRKGRLIAEHKFEALSVDNSNKLLKTLGIDKKTEKPLTLTEIYNIKEEHFVTEDKPRKIGFGH